MSLPRDRRPSPVGSAASSHHQIAAFRHPTPNEYIEALRHMHKTEKIVRLEVQRRSIRDAIRIHDEMVEDLDAQLAYVGDFKREWLLHMQRLEDARRQCMEKSFKERGDVEAEWFASTTELLASLSPRGSNVSGRGGGRR